MSWTTIISATELLSHAEDPHWKILDCRHDLTNPNAGYQAYLSGHIPQAHFVHLDTTLAGSHTDSHGKFRGRHPLPERDALIKALHSLGIQDDTQVIAYDAQGGMFAARLWWLLRWLGHAQVAVLDGGLAAWQAQGGLLSTTLPTTNTAGILQDHPPLTTTVDADILLKNLETQALRVVDARSPDRFRGENETLDAVGGHIPGAINRFFKDNLDQDGCFKSAAQLRAEWHALVSHPQTAVMQCGSGVTACHNLLALEIAGLPGAALYPGSWSEWSSDSTRPVATGS